MITPNSSLSQLQAHVAQAELARGFLTQSAADKCLPLGEEMGELFKVMVAGKAVTLPEKFARGDRSHRL